MNVQDCLNEGLLIKAKPDIEKAIASLEMAKHKLELAETEFAYKIFENSIITSYASMFYSARALLFRDGFKERSHFAVYVYVNEKYSSKIERKYLNELNSMRLHRHDLMYGLENTEAKETEADSAIKTAKGFLEAIQKLVKTI